MRVRTAEDEYFIDKKKAFNLTREAIFRLRTLSLVQNRAEYKIVDDAIKYYFAKCYKEGQLKELFEVDEIDPKQEVTKEDEKAAEEFGYMDYLKSVAGIKRKKK